MEKYHRQSLGAALDTFSVYHIEIGAAATQCTVAYYPILMRLACGSRGELSQIAAARVNNIASP
jgi:hypothetical protein